jgi:hypothetical protein
MNPSLNATPKDYNYTKKRKNVGGWPKFLLPSNEIVDTI